MEKEEYYTKGIACLNAKQYHDAAGYLCKYHTSACLYVQTSSYMQETLPDDYFKTKRKARNVFARLTILAEEHQSPVAQYHLGYCYEGHFELQDEDDEECVKWYQLAAAQGDVLAMTTLALFHRWGSKGFALDKEKSFDLLYQAYHSKSEKANKVGEILANAYRYGIGTSIDIVEALRIYSDLGLLGSKDAIAMYNDDISKIIEILLEQKYRDQELKTNVARLTCLLNSYLCRDVLLLVLDYS